MDAGAFVQENKRWLIGCAIGGLVWLIASSVINSICDPGAVQVSPTKLGAPTTAVFDRSALAAAREEGEQLTAERKRLQAELAFVPAARYVKWTGPADNHLYLVGRDLKETVLKSAGDRDVLVEDRNIGWEVTTDVDEIKRVLFGLDLIDQIQQRLFAAHDRVVAKDEDARGLAAIQSIKLEAQRAQRRMRGGRKQGEVDLQDLLQQQRVVLQFQSDEATIVGFLESCRQPDRTLIVDQWQVLRPERPGEPCTVKATLAGIDFLAPAAEADNG